MKKIVFVSHLMSMGGSEKITCTLLRAIAKTNKYEVHLLLVDSLRGFHDLIPSNIVLHELHQRRTRTSVFSLVKTLWKIVPDVIFCSEFNTMMPLWLATRFWYHGKFICRYSNMPDAQPFNKITYTLWRQVLKKADVVVQQTDEMLDAVCSYFKLPSHDNMVVYTNPLDVGQMEEAVAARESPFPPNEISLLCNAALCPRKAQDLLILAFASLYRKHGELPLKLYLLGKERVEEETQAISSPFMALRSKAEQGSFKDYLEQLCKEEKIDDRVVFLGHLNNPYVHVKYCDLFVLASRREGFPNAVLEANYFGREIVATESVPALKRFAAGHDNITIVPVDDQVKLEQAMLNAINKIQTRCDEPVRAKTHNELVDFMMEQLERDS